MLHFAASYFYDCQYSAQAIEEAFQNALGRQLKMFNPINNDTKVAVTTTTAKDAKSCIFANYNGGKRSGNRGIENSDTLVDARITNIARVQSRKGSQLRRRR